MSRVHPLGFIFLSKAMDVLSDFLNEACFICCPSQALILSYLWLDVYQSASCKIWFFFLIHSGKDMTSFFQNGGFKCCGHQCNCYNSLVEMLHLHWVSHTNHVLSGHCCSSTHSTPPSNQHLLQAWDRQTVSAVLHTISLLGLSPPLMGGGWHLTILA